MKLLIIGGTLFLGRHLVAAALQAGHSVTTFNRGSVQLSEHEQIEKLVGNRESTDDLKVLRNRSWDDVIDTCGYSPEIVDLSAKALKSSVANYTFISSISAYKAFPEHGQNENATVKRLENGDAAEYGSLKVACEEKVKTLFPPHSTTIIRPGLIVGPYDPTDRFTYWPARLARGGQILAPGDPNRPIQFIDARDLAAWTGKLLEKGISGVFNATGPDYKLTMSTFLNACAEVGNELGEEIGNKVGNQGKKLDRDAVELIWVSDEKLNSHDVSPWMELPLWIPASDEEHQGFLSVDCSKARNNGLMFTPLKRTIKDTLDWDLNRPTQNGRKAGMAPEREAKILAEI